ncbi:unnamed protein product, partial [Phaeothamnion confervicola]
GQPTWIVKPAAQSNRGYGIRVVSTPDEVLAITDGIREGSDESRWAKTGWIVQRYIERPLLIKGRKFDIR